MQLVVKHWRALLDRQGEPAKYKCQYGQLLCMLNGLFTVEITSFRSHHCQLCTIAIVYIVHLPLAHSNSTIDNE